MLGEERSKMIATRYPKYSLPHPQRPFQFKKTITTTVASLHLAPSFIRSGNTANFDRQFVYTECAQ